MQKIRILVVSGVNYEGNMPKYFEKCVSIYNSYFYIYFIILYILLLLFFMILYIFYSYLFANFH